MIDCCGSIGSIGGEGVVVDEEGVAIAARVVGDGHSTRGISRSVG